MTLLILVYSRTGNNRLLARAIAERTGGAVEAVRTAAWYPLPRVIWQMATGRRPKVRQLQHDLVAFDRLLVVAPLWDMHVAFPMTAALRANKPHVGRYDFVSFCGYVREGQPEAVRTELAELVGHPPVRQMELHVGDLVPEAQRNDPRKVSARRVTRTELVHFSDQLDTITGWYDPA